MSSTLAAGVRVAVQVRPPSDEDRPLSVPWATLRSAVVKPVTGSLKVMVTVLVSPALSAVSLTTMVAVGGVVSPGVSSLRIVPVAVDVLTLSARPSVAAAVIVAITVSSPSSVASAVGLTLNVPLKAPAAIVTVLLAMLP